MIDKTDDRSKSSEVNSHEQLQTLCMVYSTEVRISSEDINNIYDEITNLTKGSDRVTSDDKSDLEGSKVMSDDNTVDQYNQMALRPEEKVSSRRNE